MDCADGSARDGQVLVFRRLAGGADTSDHVFALVDLDAPHEPLCTVLLGALQHAWRVVDVRGDHTDGVLRRVAQDLTAAAIASGVSRLVASPEAPDGARRIVALAVGDTLGHDQWVIAEL